MGISTDAKKIRRDAKNALKAINTGNANMAVGFLEDISRLSMRDLQNVLRARKVIKTGDPLLDHVELEERTIRDEVWEAIEDLKEGRSAKAKEILLKISSESKDIRRSASTVTI